jgi:hypothetical protein
MATGVSCATITPGTPTNEATATAIAERKEVWEVLIDETFLFFLMGVNRLGLQN